MIRYNDDIDYDPVAPFFVMTQRGLATQPATAGPIESLSAAISVWAALAPDPPEIGHINLIFDGTGLAIFGFKRYPIRPPHTYGGSWVPTIPTILVSSCPSGTGIKEFMGVIDLLRQEANDLP